mgnify:FL=1
MGVVATGMHDVVDVGGIVEPRIFRHRKGVHVTAQHDRRTRLVTGEECSDSTRCRVQGDVERETIERLENAVPCLGKVEANLGPAVEISSN